MKALFIFLLTTVVLCSCNKVADPAPDEIQIPAQVIQLVESTYEDPQHMVFTEILQNKIWNVQLESRASKYSSTLNPDKILVSYRLADADVPDSLKNLLNKTVITGGEFSNFKEQEYTVFDQGGFEKVYLADYVWKGNSYLLKWRATVLPGQKPTYTVEMSPVTAKFPVAGLSDLPETLQQYIRDKAFQFSRAIISVDAQSRKSYQVYLRKNNIDFDLLFDQDCKLLAGSDKPAYLGNAGDLSEKIKAHLAAGEEYKDFGFTGQFSGIIRNEMDGVLSYIVRAQKHSGTIAGTEVWLITFGQNGDPVSRDYFALLN